MFKLSTCERMSRWKAFRKELNNLLIDDALKRTLELWADCPFVPFYLNVEQINSWPDPWLLIQENFYCDLAKVLGIVYTLHLTSHASDLEPEIRVYYDPETKHMYNIAYFCRGKYVLNLIDREIVNKEHINQRLKLKYCYTAVDLKLEQY